MLKQKWMKCLFLQFFKLSLFSSRIPQSKLCLVFCMCHCCSYCWFQFCCFPGPLLLLPPSQPCSDECNHSSAPVLLWLLLPSAASPLCATPSFDRDASGRHGNGMSRTTSPTRCLGKFIHQHNVIPVSLQWPHSRGELLGFASAVKCSSPFFSARAGTAFPPALMSLITSLVGVTPQPPMMSSLF